MYLLNKDKNMTDKNKTVYPTSKQWQSMSKEEIIKKMNPLAYKLAKRYGDNRHSEDVYQDVVLALMQCHETYDPAKGNFAPYAKTYMRRAAQQSYTRNYNCISIPYTSGQNKKKITGTDVAVTCTIHTGNESDGTNKYIDVHTNDNHMFADHTDDNFTTAIKIVLKAVQEKSPEDYKNVVEWIETVYNGASTVGNLKIKNIIRRALKGTVLCNDTIVRRLIANIVK
jgi:RNA polymerase sigma factor (sigma-70 family)